MKMTLKKGKKHQFISCVHVSINSTNLWYEEEYHSLTGPTENTNHSKGHTSKVTKSITNKHLGGVPEQGQERKT